VCRIWRTSAANTGKSGDSHADSIQQRRISSVKTASLLIISLLIAFVAVIPSVRQRSYDGALQTIRTRQEGTKEALKLLTQGCAAKQQWLWFFFSTCYDLSEVDLSGVKLRGAKLMRANLSSPSNGAVEGTTSLRAADLRDTYLKGANLSYSDLVGADLRGADIEAGSLKNAYLPKADLSSANLKNTHLRAANLSNADLSNANLSGADFRGARLLDAKFIGADLSGADFSYAKNLTPEQVKSAKNWEKAIYDEDFRKKLALPRQK